MEFVSGMFPYHPTVNSFPDYSGFAYAGQRQSPVNPAFTHSCILELRKEKSRDAARSRRGKENYEFYELAKMLPLPIAITSQLDKASIVRLTISYLKLREFCTHGDPPWNREAVFRSRLTQGLAADVFEIHQGTHILQVEMAGSSIFDYVHQGDHAEVAQRFGLHLNCYESAAGSPRNSSDEGTSSNSPISYNNDNKENKNENSSINQSLPAFPSSHAGFCIRMKSTLTKRGCHFKSSGYRVVQLQCNSRLQYTFDRKSNSPLLGIVCIAIALPPPNVNEFRLESDVFVTKMSYDLCIIHCEPRISEFCDWTSEEISNHRLYSLCHPSDTFIIKRFHEDRQVISNYYRLFTRHGGYCWMQTCATIVNNSKNVEECSVVCINYILSNTELPHLVMDWCQLKGSFAQFSATEFKSASDNSPKSESESPKRISSPSQSVHASPDRVGEAAEQNPTMLVFKRKHSDDEGTVDILPVQRADAEEVHLNWKKNNSSTNAESAPAREYEPTDFSTSALLNKRHPAIQWIGNHPPPGSLSASTFLRQLYANRESVIRSSIRPSPLFGELHAALPTPPGSDMFNEPFVQGFSYSDFHSSVTPPGSVSPRDKAPDNQMFESTFRSLDSDKVYLPIKPQAFASHLDHHSHYVHPESQLYPHPSQAFNIYHGKFGFSDSLKNGVNWYHPSS